MALNQNEVASAFERIAKGEEGPDTRADLELYLRQTMSNSAYWTYLSPMNQPLCSVDVMREIRVSQLRAVLHSDAEQATAARNTGDSFVSPGVVVPKKVSAALSWGQRRLSWCETPAP